MAAEKHVQMLLYSTLLETAKQLLDKIPIQLPHEVSVSCLHLPCARLTGLLYYLPPEAATQLLTSIARLSSPGSRVVFDFLEERVRRLQRVSVGYHSLRLVSGARRGCASRSAGQSTRAGSCVLTTRRRRPAQPAFARTAWSHNEPLLVELPCQHLPMVHLSCLVPRTPGMGAALTCCPACSSSWTGAGTLNRC